MDGFINIYIAFIMFFVVAFLLMVVFYFAVGLLLLIPIYLVGMIISIFYCKMAKNAGCKNAWIAFLPFGKNYLAFAIPHREYNIGLIKTKHRKRVFWISWILESVVYLIMGFGWAVVYTYSQLSGTGYAVKTATGFGEYPLDLILLIILLLSVVIVFAIRSIVHWRKNYDLLITYGYEQFALWGSLLNIICPFVMVIMPILMAGRVPDYGLKNYYSWEEKGIRYR